MLGDSIASTSTAVALFWRIARVDGVLLVLSAYPCLPQGWMEPEFPPEDCFPCSLGGCGSRSFPDCPILHVEGVGGKPSWDSWVPAIDLSTNPSRAQLSHTHTHT